MATRRGVLSENWKQVDRRLFGPLVGLLILGALNAMARFPCEYDFMAYHFPAALRIYGLTTFAPFDYLNEMIAGQPPGPHAVMGALFVATGRVGGTALLGVLAVSAWAGGFYWLVRDVRQTRWLVLTALAVPLVAIHL